MTGCNNMRKAEIYFFYRSAPAFFCRLVLFNLYVQNTAHGRPAFYHISMTNLAVYYLLLLYVRTPSSPFTKYKHAGHLNLINLPDR
jgi:hypothetical protein